MTPRRLGAALAIAGLALSACGGGDDGPSSSVRSYVAMGDSFAAGPGLDPQVDGSGDCGRSTVNWPSLVAEKLGVDDFTDESCTGAVIGNLIGPRTNPDGEVLPPQIDAVKKDTQLVTLSIGANDESLYSDLFTSCGSADGAANPACRPYAANRVPVLLDGIAPELGEALGAIRAKAPDAEIVVVGYLGVAPQSGTCDSLISPDDVPVMAGAEDVVDSTLADVAKDAGARYVSLRSASRGHDVCSGSSAWVNGLDPEQGDGTSLHPNGAGMKGVAKVVSAFVPDA